MVDQALKLSARISKFLFLIYMNELVAK